MNPITFWKLAHRVLRGAISGAAQALRSPGSASQDDDRRSVESALKESEARYRRLVECSPDVILVYQEGRLVFVNPAGVRLLGAASPKTLLGKSHLEFVHPDYQEAVGERMRRVAEGEMVPAMEQKWVRLDGRPVDVESTPILLAYGGRPSVQFIVRDVMAKKAAQDALRESEELYRTLARNFPNGIVALFDHDLRCTLIEGKGLKARGISKGEVEGKTLHESVPEDLIQILEPRLQAALDGISGSFEFSYGGRTFLLHVLPVQGEGGEVVAGMAMAQDVTGIKQAERARAESEKRLRLMVQQIPAILWTTDRNLRITSSMGSGLAVLGLAPNELVGRTIAEYAQNTDPDYFANRNHRRALEGETLSYEVLWVGRCLQSHLEPLKNSDGDIEGVVGLCFDITDLKETQAKLESTVSTLKATLEATADGILVVDNNARITAFNRRFTEMWNIPDEVIQSGDDGKALAFVLDQLKDPEAFLLRVQELYAQPEAESRDVLEFKDGRICERYSRPHKIGSESIGRVWSFRDVTAERRAHDALLESQRMISTLISNLPGMVYRCRNDRERSLEFAGQGAASLTGYPPDDFIYTRRVSYALLIHPHDREMVWSSIQSALAERRPYQLVYRIRTAAGQEKWVWEQGRGIFSEDGDLQALEGFITDVTERKRAEEALDQKARELARSNAELEQFAYVASHDLKEPLRVVASYLQLLEQRHSAQLPEDAQRYIERATSGAIRMQALINDLLDYSRVGKFQRRFASVDCGEVLASVLDNLKALVEESGTRVTSDPLPKLVAIEMEFVQLFQNLIVNAIKFRGGEPPRVHVAAVFSGNVWTFSVQDNGIGIDPQYAEKIFLIFQRLHPRDQYPGTGIGLAICKKIVESYGGRIWVESVPGKGSVFYFTIPDKTRLSVAGETPASLY